MEEIKSHNIFGALKLAKMQYFRLPYISSTTVTVYIAPWQRLLVWSLMCVWIVISGLVAN